MPEPSPAPAKFSVGLTGGIGSGKTTVAHLFAELGASIIDTDAIARQLTAPGGLGIAPIRDAFGADFIDAKGAMDRNKMRERVFAEPAAKQRLETILHPLIRQEVERAAITANGPYVIFDVPLLLASDYWRKRVARILVVDCPEDVQIQRVMQRSHMTREQVISIMKTQSTRSDRLAAADDVIVNDGAAEKLLPEVIRLHDQYLALSQVNPATK